MDSFALMRDIELCQTNRSEEYFRQPYRIQSMSVAAPFLWRASEVISTFEGRNPTVKYPTVENRDRLDVLLGPINVQYLPIFEIKSIQSLLVKFESQFCMRENLNNRYLNCNLRELLSKLYMST